MGSNNKTRPFVEELDVLHEFMLANQGQTANKLEIMIKEQKFSAVPTPSYTCLKWKLHVLEAQSRAEYIDGKWYANTDGVISI